MRATDSGAASNAEKPPRRLSMRDKRFWRNLTKAERRDLMFLQTARHSTGYGGGGYLPDDCSECGACGEPIMGSGWCSGCSNRYAALVATARGERIEAGSRSAATPPQAAP